MKQYIRCDLREYTGYVSARTGNPSGTVWLNANEAPEANAADPASQRYPEPQPPELIQRLAEYYEVAPNQVLAGRGSDELIDVLIRTTCHARQDGVLISPPTFGMYRVSAELHGAFVYEAPLIDNDTTWDIPWTTLSERALSEPVKLVFLCSPGNPTGNVASLTDIAALAATLEGRALVVVDEAYQEFASAPSAATLIAQHENIVVLRTLSKAFALAGARVGAAFAQPKLIAHLRACQAPYPLPTPSVAAAVVALSEPQLSATSALVAMVIAERQRLAEKLTLLPAVRAVYGSAGNFVLVRFADAALAFARLLEAGIVVRDQRSASELGDALRISIGTRSENDRVLACLEAL